MMIKKYIQTKFNSWLKDKIYQTVSNYDDDQYDIFIQNIERTRAYMKLRSEFIEQHQCDALIPRMNMENNNE